MEKFRIRCSAIGEIMSTKGLGKTGESYLQTWQKERLYGKRKEFTSKYTEKGLLMEDDAIDFVSLELGLGLVLKNERQFENDFLTGTPDVILNDGIIDIKCSWDCWTFPLFDDTIPNKDYWWQLQGYMALTDQYKAKLIYCLLDTPYHLIEAEAKKRHGSDWDAMFESVQDEMTYSDLPAGLRMKVFEFERDEAAIQQIKDRVEMCRAYLESLPLVDIIF